MEDDKPTLVALREIEEGLMQRNLIGLEEEFINEFSIDRENQRRCRKIMKNP